MRFLFLMNRVEELKASQATALLMFNAAMRGHEVDAFGVADCGIAADGSAVAQVARLTPDALDPDLDPKATVAALREAERETVCLNDCDLMVIRTNPGRDTRAWAHTTALDIARLARDRGLRVLNDPDGLQIASNKLYLTRFPETCRPRTVISRDPETLRAFVLSEPAKAVLKPLSGTQGRDVFFIDTHRPRNLRQIIDVLTREGYAMAQEYLPEARKGDTRVIVMHGRPLSVGGKVAGVRRIPAKGELRSNVAAGGRAAPAQVTEEMWRIAELIGQQLVDDGIHLAGLDFIGTRVCEINVFSTGGLLDAGRFLDADFVSPIVESFEEAARQPLEAVTARPR